MGCRYRYVRRWLPPGPHHREPRLQHLQGRQRYQRYQDHDHRTEGRLGPRRRLEISNWPYRRPRRNRITVIDTSIVMVPNCTAATATFALLPACTDTSGSKKTSVQSLTYF